MPIIVKDFWIEPANPPLSIKEITFGYTNKGKEYEYKAQIKDKDIESFHKFIFALLASKKKSILPWIPAKNVKDKVTIINKKDESVQLELPLKVATNFITYY